jgi:hypothetical protein
MKTTPQSASSQLRAIAAAICTTSMLWTLPSYAQGPGWTANSTVVKLVVVSNGGINVRLSPDVTGCVSQGGYGPNYASVLPSHPGLKEIKADLLAAYLTGGVISLYLSDANCTVGETQLGGW